MLSRLRRFRLDVKSVTEYHHVESLKMKKKNVIAPQPLLALLYYSITVLHCKV